MLNLRMKTEVWGPFFVLIPKFVLRDRLDSNFAGKMQGDIEEARQRDRFVSDDWQHNMA